MEQLSTKNKSAQKLGKIGGQKTASLYGKKHFSNAGKLGMAKRWAKKKSQSPTPPEK